MIKYGKDRSGDWSRGEAEEKKVAKMEERILKWEKKNKIIRWERVVEAGALLWWKLLKREKKWLGGVKKSSLGGKKIS